jgi:hypothetical protein
MARDIAEGYLLVTERTFKPLGRPDLDQLTFELERHLRELRGDQAPLDDVQAIQARNRKIQRMNTAMMVLRSYRAKAKL